MTMNKEYMNIDFEKVMQSDEKSINEELKSLKQYFDKSWFNQTAQLIFLKYKVKKSSLEGKRLLVAECLYHLQTKFNNIVDKGVFKYEGRVDSEQRDHEITVAKDS
jgi:hypothetical protein